MKNITKATLVAMTMATGVSAAGGFSEEVHIGYELSPSAIAERQLTKDLKFALDLEKEGDGSSIDFPDILCFRDSYSMAGVPAGGEEVSPLY